MGEEETNNQLYKQKLYKKYGLSYRFQIIYEQDKLKEYAGVPADFEAGTKATQSHLRYIRKRIKLGGNNTKIGGGGGVKITIPFSRKRVGHKGHIPRKNRKVSKGRINWRN